jgi:pimeloyl-ACP methyl ester carboxylesterase
MDQLDDPRSVPTDPEATDRALTRRGALLGGAGVAATSLALAALPGTARADGGRAGGRADDDVDLQPVPVPPQVPATEGRVSFGTGSLWYWDTGGSGEPIVLMHAASGSGASWVYQQPVFAQAGYRVIGYSRRGHRNSDAGTGDPGTFADDLNALVEHLQLPRVHLVGTALGSIGAADYLLSFPDRVISAALTCSLVTLGDADYLARSNALRPQPQWSTLPPEFQELGPSYRAMNPEGVEAWKREQALAPSPTLLQRTRTPVTAAALSGARAPILLATGDADLYTPPAMLRELGRAIPNARQVIFTDSGHNAYWERPILFNRTVLEFICS